MKKKRKKKKQCQFRVNSIVSTITEDVFYCWGVGWSQRGKVQESWFIPKMPWLFPFLWKLLTKYLSQLSSSTMGMEKEQRFGFVLKAGPVGQRNFKNITVMSGKFQPKDTQQNGQRQNLGSWPQCHSLNNNSTYLVLVSSNCNLLGGFRLWRRFSRAVGNRLDNALQERFPAGISIAPEPAQGDWEEQMTSVSPVEKEA